MKSGLWQVAAALAVAAGVLTAHGQSISTPVSNNGTGGVFLNLTPGPTPLVVTGFATQLGSTAGQVVNVEVWTRPGTYVGFTGSSAGWTLTQTVAATSGGTTTNSPVVVLPVQISLPAGATTGVYLHSITTNGGLRFTGVNATPPQTTWSNADVTLFSDFARTGVVSFAGNTSTPRCFAGTIYYVSADASGAGACCSLSGVCQTLLASDCQAAAGLYQGTGSACSPSTCPQPGSCCNPSGACTAMLQGACIGLNTWTAGTACGAPCPTGACCLLDGSCTINYQSQCAALSGYHAGDSTTCPSGVLCFPDVEPNNAKSEARAITMSPGDVLRGHSTGTTTTAGSTLDTTSDTWRIRTPAAALGVYRYRLLLNASSGYATNLLGLTQTAATAGPWPGAVGAATATESTGQGALVVGTDTTVTWYGFGKQEQVYYRVGGGAANLGGYQVTLERTPVTPTDIGSLLPGTLTFTTVNVSNPAVTDTALRIFDSGLNPIAGYANDDASTNGGAAANSPFSSFLRRTFSPGVYYLAMTAGDLSTNQGAPCDDNTRTGVLMDFPDAAMAVNPPLQLDASFSVDDGSPHLITATRAGRTEIAWFRFTVSPAVVTGACCAPTGVCTAETNTNCLAIADAVYQGTGTACATSPCQPGACCLADTTCSVAFRSACSAAGGLHLGDGTTCAAPPCLIETEPNSTRFEANPIAIASGQTLHGRNNGNTSVIGDSSLESADYFRLKTPAMPLGIYRHAMTLEDTAVGHSTALRCVAQSPTLPGPWPGPVGFSTGTEVTGQPHVLLGSSRVNYWYGFGKQEEVMYRVASGGVTSALYAATLTTTQVTPTDLGSFVGETLVITTGSSGHNNDTSLRVFNANLEPIEGYANDGASTYGGSPGDSGTVSFLQRSYSPGTYYLAITIGDLATDHGAPCDDNDRTGAMIEFPNAVVSADTSETQNVGFLVYDGTVHPFAALRGGRAEVAWFRFTVTAPPSGACCTGSDCTVQAPALCGQSGGAYQGDGVACQTTTCAQPGVCCRGATCTTTLGPASCAPGGNAGSVYTTAGGASCNSGGATAFPCCYADYNKQNGISVADIFDYLTDWFAGSPFANTGGNGALAPSAVQNIFDFLGAWFAGGC